MTPHGVGELRCFSQAAFPIDRSIPSGKVKLHGPMKRFTVLHQYPTGQQRVRATTREGTFLLSSFHYEV